MAKFSASIQKKSTLPPKSTTASRAHAVAAAAPGTFAFIDNEDDTCTVSGLDKAGAPVPIDTVATLAVTSSDPTLVSVDAPSGMTFMMHGLLPGSATIHVVATWNDGSLGPFAFDLPVSVSAGPASGLVVTPGQPVARP